MGRLEKLKEELECLERRYFDLEMKDGWSPEDFEISRKIEIKAKKLEAKIKELEDEE